MENTTEIDLLEKVVKMYEKYQKRLMLMLIIFRQ